MEEDYRDIMAKEDRLTELENEERSPVERGVIPAYGQKVSYVMEDGEKVAGKVIGIDNYENHVLVTVKKKDGSLYGAKLKRKQV